VRRLPALLGCAALVGAAACLPRLTDDDFTRGSAVREGVLRDGGEPITLTYLGVAGWLLDTGRSTLLTAPLFSNPGLLATGLAAVEADSAAIEAALALLDVPELMDVSAILVGHAHYDHLMDVPYLATHHARRAVILGNTTMAHTLAPFAGGGLDPARVQDVSASAASVAGGGAWVRVAPDLRVLPLLSDHAPHFQGVVLYGGGRSRALRRIPRGAGEWLEGETLAFLIDVLDAAGEVRLRLYFQDAVAREPYGLVPPELAPVDVALVVPATFSETDWHPEAILENTRARRVVLGHWEDFFQPVSLEPDPVPFTLLPDFLGRLGRALDGEARWDLPMPGTRFVFR
jgi:L-ascorbate metabolism protein UlaG (beta-lactamase superfamily)